MIRRHPILVWVPLFAITGSFAVLFFLLQSRSTAVESSIDTWARSNAIELTWRVDQSTGIRRNLVDPISVGIQAKAVVPTLELESSDRKLVIPFWLVAALAVLPTALLWRRKSRENKKISQQLLKWAGLAACLFLLGVWCLGQAFSSYRLKIQIQVSAQHYSIRSDCSAFLFEDQESQVRVNSLGEFGVGFDAKAVWPYADRANTIRPRAVIPLWVPLVAIAVPTMIGWRHRRKQPEGHCQSCGYDLQGNESGLCPECGKGWVRIGEAQRWEEDVNGIRIQLAAGPLYAHREIHWGRITLTLAAIAVAVFACIQIMN